MATQICADIPTAIARSTRTAVAPLTWDPVGHLLSRFAFGPTPADRAAVTKNGFRWWFGNQKELGAQHLGYSGHAGVRAVGPQLTLSPYDARQWLKAHGGEYGWTIMDQLTQVTVGLQAWSPAQLYETLVDFFSNHLNVPNHAGDMWNTRHAYDRDVIRRYAMGSFTDMLLASAKHPAMLTYLNLADSTKAAINENYGRELLELHTVGLRYSEPDVRNAASMLTGRTLDQYQHYVFDDYIHPTGPVKVLGFGNANAKASAGEAAGDALLRYLAGHSYTATNLARKMCVRFVSDNPSAKLVAAVADAYLENKTQILPMVQTILRSTEFWESRGRKVRRPAENVVATIRALQPTISDYGKATQALHWITSDMNNVPLDWPAPNGYPDVASAWRSAGNLLAQWNVHIGIAGGWWQGFKAPAISAMYPGAATSGDAISQLTKHLTGMKFSSAHRAALQKFLGEPAGTPMANSTIRWEAYPLAALVLDAPHHALR
jgi:Protein of unknown function (DUF1800)